MIIPSEINAGAHEMKSHLDKYTSDTASPLFSVHADREGFEPLLEAFVNRLKSRIEDFEEAWEIGNCVELRALAHKLKGAAGGYGFPEIAQIASQIEDIADHEKDLNRLPILFGELEHLCHRARLGLRGE